jgi:hypothetical protein
MKREPGRGRWWLFLGAVAAILATGRVARAQEAEAEADSEVFSHKHQIGLHLQGGVGYAGVFPYDGEFCGELDDEGMNKNCLGRSPWGLDIGLSYGLTRRLEIIAETRLGLERDVGPVPGDDDGPHSVAIAPGIKGYIADIGPTHIFMTLQLVVDFTSYDQVDDTDIGGRNANGVQIDLSDNFGIYAFVGEQLTARRWLRFEVEGGFGAQVRIP